MIVAVKNIITGIKTRYYFVEKTLGFILDRPSSYIKPCGWFSDYLVASNRLGCSRASKDQITNECTNSHGEHDPAIIRHEEEPFKDHAISM